MTVDQRYGGVEVGLKKEWRIIMLSLKRIGLLKVGLSLFEKEVYQSKYDIS